MQVNTKHAHQASGAGLIEHVLSFYAPGIVLTDYNNHDDDNDNDNGDSGDAGGRE